MAANPLSHFLANRDQAPTFMSGLASPPSLWLSPIKGERRGVTLWLCPIKGERGGVSPRRSCSFKSLLARRGVTVKETAREAKVAKAIVRAKGRRNSAEMPET